MDNEKSIILLPTGTVDVFEQEKGKYTLVKDSPVSTQQILKIVQRTPKEHIHQRPGKGGGKWDYVTGTYVKKVLNFTFGWLWDFQVIDKGTVGGQIWVQGRLTIRAPKTFEPILIKEQFGGADIKFKKGTKVPLDYANDLKAATTDALKKCASELGIASDIYGKNEFKEMGAKVDTPPAPPQVNKPAPQSVTTSYDCHGVFKGGCPHGAIITKAEYDFSMRLYKRALCRKCQQVKKSHKA
jgi:Rad52/22 family double-strand break repair protein